MLVDIDALYRDDRGTREAESALESDMLKLCTEFGVLVDAMPVTHHGPEAVSTVLSLRVPDSVGMDGFERRAKKALGCDGQASGATREWLLFMRAERGNAFEVRSLGAGGTR